MKNLFSRIAHKASEVMGMGSTFVLAVLLILAWLYSGSYFDYSDTWQLVINTSTTIITFLMVFLIQNTQNRDTKAINLKLDELIQTHKNARNKLIDIEDDTDEALELLETQFKDYKSKN